MDSRERFAFFEKLYFHELEAREQMTTRVQIPLTLLTAAIGALGFMGQNIDREISNGWTTWFYSLFLLSVIFVIVSGYFCTKCASGHWYQMTSFANQWQDYYQSCVDTYASQPAENRISLTESAFLATIQGKYVECASANARINELRAYYFNRTINLFLVALSFISVTFIIYFIGSLDKSLHNRPAEIKIVTPVLLKGDVVNTKTAPPPPPPPPPTRYVRDDRPPATKPTPAPNVK